jgi:hypothetical protein
MTGSANRIESPLPVLLERPLSKNQIKQRTRQARMATAATVAAINAETAETAAITDVSMTTTTTPPTTAAAATAVVAEAALPLAPHANPHVMTRAQLIAVCVRGLCEHACM